MTPLSGCTSHTVGTSWSLKWRFASMSSSSEEEEDEEEEDEEEEEEEDEEEDDDEESRASVTSVEDWRIFASCRGMESLRFTARRSFSSSSSTSSTISSDAPW